jgi:hypothetical protein
MARFAKFTPGSKQDKYLMVEFTPQLTDTVRMNMAGPCYYREGFWYVPFGLGVPADQGIVWDGPATGYPDGNPKSAQGAKKYSLRYLPLSAAIEVNRALEDGAKKYGAANWREKGVAASVYVDACKRHLDLYFDCKQDNASDSGVHNLGHAMACLAIIIDAEKAGTLTDDRPFPFPDGDKLLMRG